MNTDTTLSIPVTRRELPIVEAAWRAGLAAGHALTLQESETTATIAASVAAFSDWIEFAICRHGESVSESDYSTLTDFCERATYLAGVTQ